MSKTPYVVLARKYRPQGFEELLGQPAVAVTLKNAIASKKLAHAYLFTGPRGVGKTTMARILAKALNCKDGPTPEPCGKCDACGEIAASSCLDVLEMDAASHTSVDNVRQVIIETVALAPSRDRYKIFIIDEAHMLSASAFNALLKTLEEPPAHVVFILATTETAKIPATIASRCQRFRFRPVTVELLQEHLGVLAKKEKIDIEPEALELLARSAEGSLRDGVGLLDQSRSYSERKITAEVVREMFGFVPQDLLLGTGRALLAKDSPALAQWLRKIYDEGVEPAQLLKDLRAALEGAYLARLSLSGTASPAWIEAAKPVSTEGLGFLLRRLNRSLEELRWGDSPRLSLELNLFACVEAAWDLAAWAQRLERLEKRLVAGAPVDMPAPGARPPAPAGLSSDASTPAASGRGPWADLVAAAHKEKPAVATVLQKARLSEAAGSWKLVTARQFDVDQLKRAQTWIEAKLATISGKTVHVQIELGQAGPTAPAARADSGDEGPAGSGASEVAEPDEPPAPSAALSKAQQILGGKVRIVKKPQ